MNRMIAYENAEGGVSVLHTVEHLPDETHENWLMRMAPGIPANARNVTIVTEVPPNRSDRHLWAIEDDKVVVRSAEVKENEQSPVLALAPIAIPPPLPAIPVIEAIPEPEPQAPTANWSLSDLLSAAHEETNQQPLQAEEQGAPLPPPAPEPVAAADPIPPVTGLAKSSIDLTSLPTTLPPMPIKKEWAPTQLPEMPVTLTTDAERRHSAEAMVTRVLSGRAIITPEQNIRYEVALQAKNQSVPAMMMMSEEAGESGLEVQALCDRIIMERTLQEQRIMRAYAIKARALRAIREMEGQAIWEVADAAVKEIEEV